VNWIVLVCFSFVGGVVYGCSNIWNWSDWVRLPVFGLVLFGGIAILGLTRKQAFLKGIVLGLLLGLVAWGIQFFFWDAMMANEPGLEDEFLASTGRSLKPIMFVVAPIASILLGLTTGALAWGASYLHKAQTEKRSAIHQSK